MTFLLELGRIQELSHFEISRLFRNFSHLNFTDRYVSVETDDEKAFLERVQKSGGITKASRALIVLDEEKVFDWIVEYLSKQDKPEFLLNFHNEKGDFHIDQTTVKKALKEKGVSSRFLHTSGGSSTALLLHHPEVIELTCIEYQGKITVAQTIWVQNIDDWTLRDRNKPYRDRKKGMLPPKLARMMVNFVSTEIQDQNSKKLYDPFCGTGTVLMEASLIGWEVSGSDISSEAVHGTAENMHWFAEIYNKPEPKGLFVADATHVSPDQTGHVDAIVTEPFLGKPQPNPKDVPNIFKGLEKLYLGCFKQWTKVLKDGGEVVIVTPLVETPKHTYSLQKLIDNIQSLGYNLVSGPMIYRREQTIVQRAIYVLKYKK